MSYSIHIYQLAASMRFNMVQPYVYLLKVGMK